ncbi:MAG: hypothetical protein IKO43_06930, partial [Kiritimatiellae bacterium]|nr:hypothetical protein [Kiritimatiellia bacterium]
EARERSIPELLEGAFVPLASFCSFKKRPGVRQLGVQSQRAVQELAQGRDAVIRNEYGDIEYNIGRPGKIAESGKIKGGIGLMHIVYARMVKDGATLEEALHTAMFVADALETGREVNIQYNKHYFRKGDIEAIFAINPGSDKPVLTGYKIRAGEPNGAIRASSGLRTIPPPRKETVVAALSRILANLPPARQGGAALRLADGVYGVELKLDIPKSDPDHTRFKGQTLKTKVADAVLSVRLRSEEPLLTSDYETSAKETVRLGDIVPPDILPQSAPARQEGAADAQGDGICFHDAHCGISD